MSDSTYAPKSPDLSSIYDPGPTSNIPPIAAQVSQPLTGGGPQLLSQQSPSQFSPQQLLHLQPSTTYQFSDAPRSTYQPHSQLQQSQHQLSASPHSLAQVQAATNALGYSTRPLSIARQQYYPPVDSFPQQQSTVGYLPQGPPTTSPYFQYGSTLYPQQQQQQQHQSPVRSQQQLQHQFSAPQQKYHQQQQDFYNQPTPVAVKAEEPDSNSQSNTMPPRRAAAQPPPPPAIDPSPVKTKFPTARIKRIMQADEEVGKVAQQTPIAVGKALELFMVQLVTKSADVAREKNSKRVSAQMLKQVVESDDQWDFLRDIVSRVENEEKAGKAGHPNEEKAGKAGGRPRPESESEEEVVEKKRARPGRKKKV
ncbi:hypothetical protein V8F20_009328 [Naviculisporaceae sp. PSN 640]